MCGGTKFIRHLQYFVKWKVRCLSTRETESRVSRCPILWESLEPDLVVGFRFERREMSWKGWGVPSREGLCMLVGWLVGDAVWERVVVFSEGWEARERDGCEIRLNRWNDISSRQRRRRYICIEFARLDRGEVSDVCLNYGDFSPD